MAWMRSGGHTTFPIGTFSFNGNRHVYYSTSGTDTPAGFYHRLDLSMTWKERIKKKRKWQGEWVAKIFIFTCIAGSNAFAL